MILSEFIEKFVRPNTLIRLWTPLKGGHEQVDGEFPIMEWKLKDRPQYANMEVLGVTDILVPGHYVEAVNIVVEK